MSETVSRAHRMIDLLEKELGSLDHLYFAFPQVRSVKSQSLDDPAAVVVGAIAMSRNPPKARVRSTVGPKHPLPSTYLEIRGISGVETVVPTNPAKKLLKGKRCLVIEQWGQRFVCRVPHEVRDKIVKGTVAVVGIPPEHADWNVEIVRALQETARKLSASKSLAK